MMTSGQMQEYSLLLRTHDDAIVPRIEAELDTRHHIPYSTRNWQARQRIAKVLGREEGGGTAGELPCHTSEDVPRARR